MKPYDLTVLLAAFKTRGLDLGEDAAKGVVDDICLWLTNSAKASPSPFDDIVAVALPHVRAVVMRELDKIDGKVDQVYSNA